MKKNKVIINVLSSILLIGSIAGCSNSSSTDSAKKESGTNVLKIATNTPLSGSSATLGESIKLGAQLAIEDKKEDFKKLGIDLQLVPYDDQGDPKKGVANAQLIAADTATGAVIGHLNSGVSIAASEIYEKNNLAMVSPSSTAISLTDRNFKSVNRTCARDDFQGPAGAEFAINTLKAKTIFIIQDKTSYGQGLADAFKKSAEEKGAKVVAYEGITPGEKDFNGVINQIQAKNPDLVYFGGIYSEGGIIIKQAREKGLTMPFMGGDGLDSSSLVEIAGDKVINTYFTSTAGDASKTEKGKAFAERYKAKFGKPIESFSAYGYDATASVLQAIEKDAKANGNKVPSREQIVKDVRAITDYEGMVTKIGFDNKGDNKFAKIYIFKFNEAKYPATQESEISK